jgi:transposase
MPRVRIGPALPDREQLDVEITRLRDLDVGELRNRWHAVFGRPAPPRLPRHLLFRVVAYRLQADRFGDLDSESQRLLDHSGSPEKAGQSAVDLVRRIAAGGQKEIDAQVPEALDIHIVMDNYATHKAPKIRAWLARRPHYHVHFTPTSASWINQVERWFAELTRKRLRRGVHTSVKQLEADIRSFIDRHNQNPRPFKWTKSADQILASVKRFCHKAQQTLCGEL